MMFGLFKANPEKKLQMQYQKLLKEAMDFQRNGDIRSYSDKTAEAEAVFEEIKQLKEQSKK